VSKSTNLTSRKEAKLGTKVCGIKKNSISVSKVRAVKTNAAGKKEPLESKKKKRPFKWTDAQRKRRGAQILGPDQGGRHDLGEPEEN